MRIVTICSAWGSQKFNIGIEFLDVIEDHKRKLAETVEYLLAS